MSWTRWHGLSVKGQKALSSPLKIYLAGPITNTSDFRDRFAQAKLELVQLGYVPISPLDVPKDFEDTGKAEIWLAAMRVDIPALINCDGIYLLRGWENSRGARLEKLIADGLDLLVLYQDDEAKEKSDG